jgi:hypothetical protein
MKAVTVVRPLTYAACLAAVLALMTGDAVPQEPVGPAPTARTAQVIPPTRAPGPKAAGPLQAGLGLTAAGATANEIRDALDLSAGDAVSISTGTSDPAAVAVFNSSVASFPTKGSSYLVMSTGNTASALTPNNSPSTSTILGGLNNSQSNDMTQVVLTLNAPAGATCVAFDFRYFSEEFPEFVGSQFNDAFIAEIGQSTFQIVNNQVIAPNNFAFDTQANVISVNTVFGVTPGAAAGTTYDGATPLLTAVSPLDAPGQVTITLTITDLGDSIYDSTAFVDNFRWFYGLSCTPGADADSDGDGLLDDWETNGIDFDKDGTVDLDLPAFGADPLHKDIFVEIDYMVLGGVGGHTHKPKAAALQTVIDAFDNAPLTNPDGTNGVHLHVDAGADTIMNPVTGDLWGTRSRSDALAHQEDLGTGAYDWSAFDAIKGLGVPGSFSIERADVFHYCIFAHDLSATLTSTSGISRGIPASDLIVSLGSWSGSTGTVNQQAGTFMHELGHNLSLRHGGDDHRNNEPNYPSVMNYSFQTLGLRLNGADGTFDYSRFHLPVLNENALNEPIGLSGVAGTAGYGTRYCSGGVQRIADNINGPIDWHFDGDGGTEASVAQDVNCDGQLTILDNSNNWAEVKFDGGAVGHLGEQIELPQVTEANEVDLVIDGANVAERRVSIAGCGEVTLQACEAKTYEYVVTNTGQMADTYDIAVSATQPWADTSGLPSVLSVGPGASKAFAVPVSIPKGTPDGSVDQLKISVISSANQLMHDVVQTSTKALSVDGDGDGLTDFCDACSASDLAPTIVVGTCDSGVSNRFFDYGCTMSDLVGQCARKARNHGKFVSCVALLTNEWKAKGLITGQMKGAIERCAAKAALP